MSDPVTNAEVEDVLSSIRRLVSEDKRPLHVAQRDKASDRLVLTPALRVAEDTSSFDDVNHVTDENQQTADDQALPNDDAANDPDDEGVLVLGQHPEGAAADGNQAQDDDDHDDQSAAATDHGQSGLANTDSDTAFDDPAHDYDADPYNFSDESDNDGEGEAEHSAQPSSDMDADERPDEASEIFAAEPSHDSSEHVDGPADDGPEPDRPEQEFAQAEDEDAQSEQPAPAEVDEHSQDLGDDVQSPTSKAAALRAKIEELEAALGSISGNWDTAGGPSAMKGSIAQDAMAWEDASPEDAITSRIPAYEADVDGADQDDFLLSDALDTPVDTDERDSKASSFEQQFHDDESSGHENSGQWEVKAAIPVLDYGEDEQLIDEEALRDMVSEIVRAELQGALGERITRNVRKLVRREIHRALTAQDLE